MVENYRDVSVEDVLSRLKAPRRNGNRGYMALCPFHNDTEHSLHVGPGNGFYCYGCGKKGTLKELSEALGIVAPEYYDRTLSSPMNIGHRAKVENRGVVTHTYVYRDENNVPLYRVLRYDPKGFSQQSAIYKGDKLYGWLNSMRGVRRVLYNLPDILRRKDEVILIVEGEKDADTLQEKGFLATTSAMGACKWSDEYSYALRFRTCIVIPDNDGPGRSHAEQVRLSLERYGCRVRTLVLPGLKDKGDVTDWIEAGGTAEELKRLIDEALK